MRLILFLCLTVISFAGYWEGFVDDDSLRARVEQSLVNSGENRENLERAILRADNSIREGVIFLIANSPAVNLVAYDTESLLREVALAYEAREKYPWGKDAPIELFLHYVLPNQITQEELTYYRGYFSEQFDGFLDTIETGSEAAIAINYWCGERVRFQQTQRQDQNVFHTLSSGYGRCEEMMIVYVSALRAAGIPARQAWTPYWAHSDNNHAWTELWADGQWHFAGSCEPKPSLDDAWFNKSATRAAVIMSSAFGVPEGDEILYRAQDNYAIINSTPHYIENPAKLIVETERESTDVFLAVFNFGALRPIMRINTGDSTSVEFVMGRGTYNIYAGDDSTFAQAVVTTEYGATENLRLIPQPNAKMGEESFWLRYSAE
ncbi:MAG: transglutaminase-like domain-containing protein [bacterium]